MFGRNVRLAALATTAAGALLLAGCSAGDQANAPPPRSDYQQADAGTPDLMGAAPAPDASQAQDGLLGGPVAATGDTRVSSQPLPPPPARNTHLKTWRRPDGTLVTAMRPIANPKGSSRYEQQRPAAKPHRVYATAPAAPKAASHPAPVVQKPVAAKPPIVAKPVAPKTVAPAPAPVQAAKPVLPATPLNKPPVVAAKPVVPVTPAKPATKLEKLQAAVAPEATNGAVLAAGESLGKNQPGQVTLSLPATLGDLIKQEAAKLGLGKAAKKTSAYAELSGEGYEVTPNGRQTAVVKPGEPTTFAWQVKPGPDAKGQLKSDFGVELNGAKEPQGFALGTISKRVAALPEKVKKGFGQLDLGALNGNISLPGLGSVPMKTALGVALVLLALIILVGVSRNAAAARRRAERQRKYRTLTDYGRNEMEFEDPKPSSAHVSYVNPFVAAAGGAAVGAVAASAMSHHDDHGHGHDDHGHHDAHADHGHADHGHADQGHGHDLHAEAHPEPHAPAEHVGYTNPFMANTSHDGHGQGHDAHAADHGHGHDDHGHHAPADPGHGDQGHGAHDAHHKEPEHAH
ncbi:stalk-specific protein X [Caulobacter sp.]|uniref:stalk-specific protein StpX n=1 Tax=Caulobacter sp. TaxID=78 RepID=UPI001B093B02|nr:stalk-specific protein X [Caulobacter sp.]MBO9543148.1 stalk-specific protein X [Caulobacter sp.]